jgi:DNA-binding Xre family transcriptional regulator
MSAFRKNIDMYLAEKDITIKSLSEEADIPFETLKNFLYGNPQDCKLSTAVKLARALNISVDELIGAETLRFDFKNNSAICRNLPESSMYLINWLVRHQEELYANVPKNERIISVMHLIETYGGNMMANGEFDRMNISHLYNDLKAKVFVGMNFDTERYMPVYSPYNILLIANDRLPFRNEHCIIIHGGHFFIAKRIADSENVQYRSVNGNRLIANESDIDELVGYIAHVISDMDSVNFRL